jgi:hypothetical protein
MSPECTVVGERSGAAPSSTLVRGWPADPPAADVGDGRMKGNMLGSKGVEDVKTVCLRVG